MYRVLHTASLTLLVVVVRILLQLQANAEGMCWLDGFLSIALDSNSMSPIVRWDRPAVVQAMFDRRLSPENAQLLGSWLPRQRYVLSALQELPRDKLMAHLRDFHKAPAVANLWLSSQVLNIIEEKQRLVNLTLQHVSVMLKGGKAGCFGVGSWCVMGVARNPMMRTSAHLLCRNAVTSLSQTDASNTAYVLQATGRIVSYLI